ncbi:MAG: histidine phosphatase family protein [Tissierellia bacterium]|nr:histidine phosphatase family protein [Tissierellia bacterium]
MDIILLRHTSSKDNERAIFSRPSTDLSSLGSKQMKLLLEKDYPVKKIYSSPYRRSLLLAEALSEKLHLPLYVDERLREIDFGEFEGKTFEQIESLYPREVEQWMKDPWNFAYPGGEDFHNMRSRAQRFYKELDQSSLIISHQALMLSLMSEILEYSYTDLSRFYLGSGARVHLKSSPWRLLSLENL